MSKNRVKYKEDPTYLSGELFNNPKELSRNKFLRKKGKNKERKKLKKYSWE